MDKLRKYVADNKKKVIFYMLFICIFVVSAVVMYKRNITNAMVQPRSVMSVKNITSWWQPSSEISVKRGSELEQHITMVSSNFTGFSLTFQKKEEKEDCVVWVKLTNSNGELVETWIVDTSEIEGNVKKYFYISPMDVNVGDVYSIFVSTDNEDSGITIETRNIKGENKLLHELAIKGAVDGSELEHQSLSYDILDGACGSLKYFYMVVVAGIFIYILSMILLNIKEIKKEWIFAISVFIVGSIYILVLPPYTVPDEASHFVTAYAESSIFMGKEVFDENGYIILQPEVAQYLTRAENPDRSRYANLIRNVLGKEGDITQNEISTRKPLSMKNLGYAPQVIGTVIGRLLKLNGDQLIILGRIFALIWYCIVMFWSIRIIPEFGKNALFVVGMLPMTIQMVASYNYDSVLIGACLFLTSYILYLAYDEKKTAITIRDYVLLLIAVVIIIPIKFVYFPLLGLGILIPKEKFGGMKQKNISAFALVIGAIISLLLTRIGNIVSAVSVSSSTGNAVEKYTIMTFIEEPVRTLVTIFLTFENNITAFYESMIGNQLGWLEITIPNIVVYGFTILLFFSILLRGKDICFWNDRTRVWNLFLAGCSALVLALVFLLDMTPINSDLIIGIQGRYFIPILPLILFAFQNKRILIKGKMDELLNSCACVLHIIAIMSAMTFIVNR